MKISYNWLKDYLKINLPVDKVSEILTNTGLEVEGVELFEAVKGGLKGVVVGEVVDCEQHPNADRLKTTKVDVGDNNVLNIVCGAPNVAVGQKVLVATVGTELPDGKGGSFKIKKGKIRGEVSMGMICAEDELGLGDSHDGIMVLSDEAVPGTLASDFLNFYKDEVIEIGLTPNRTDAMGHFGVARDLRAGLLRESIQSDLELPDISSFSIDNDDLPIEVSIDSPDCGHYYGLTIKDALVQESPDWLKNKLNAIGLSPINNVVDVTNFVLHELGHPLHAFNADTITKGKISIKNLTEDSIFVTLDEKERKLNSQDLMICNGDEPLCIAGVFGGLHSGVDKESKNIFLEAAWFDSVSIRKTAKRHAMNTDASFRYERGVDPEMTLFALKRAAILIRELTGGKISSEIKYESTRSFTNAQVEMRFSRINDLIGQEIPKSDVREILQSLDIEVMSEAEDVFNVKIPLYRADVSREADVVEEILRIYGLNNVDLPSRISFSVGDHEHSSSSFRSSMNNFITDRGFQEIQNNSLTRDLYYEAYQQFPADSRVKILNPLSSDLNALRQSLLFGFMEVVRLNINHKNSDLRLVEFGKTYSKNDSGFNEEEFVGMLISGNRISENWEKKSENAGFFTLKGDVKRVFEKFNVSITKELMFKDEFFEEGISLVKGEKILARMGRVSSKVLNSFDVDQDVFFAEINFRAFEKAHLKSKTIYREISKFPSVRRDLALLVDKSVNYSDMENAALSNIRGILKEVNLFDVYEGKNLPENKKSYALSFILQDSKKTLNDKQIESTMSRLISVFKKEFDAVLR